MKLGCPWFNCSIFRSFLQRSKWAPYALQKTINNGDMSFEIMSKEGKQIEGHLESIISGCMLRNPVEGEYNEAPSQTEHKWTALHHNWRKPPNSKTLQEIPVQRLMISKRLQVRHNTKYLPRRRLRQGNWWVQTGCLKLICHKGIVSWIQNDLS